ncbi:MAG: ankyrin repeat domain-containing protein [Treponema sp.]|jgi:ankyrin repeat protein|nr:ankyrin repeat domain-containing protein [Treponema sp.]
MKCRYPLPALLILCGAVFLALMSCAGTPQAEEVNEDVWTALESGETEKARSFFLGKVDVHATDAGGRTPLHIAAEKGDAQLGAFFISLGANVNALDNEGRSPLGISAEQGDTEMARILVRGGVNGGANIHQPVPGIGSATAEGIIRKGEFLEALLSADSLESRDAEGRTILHLAALAGEAEAAGQILEALASLPGRDIMTADKDGKTALDLALARPDSRDHAEIAEMLILAGGRSRHPVYPYFASAVRSSNYNIRFYDGGTPLHFAARENYPGLIKFFIERRAEINIKDASGATPLYEAARYGNIEALELLLSLGADPNVQDAKGNSVLHIGIPAEIHREAIGLLLAYQANPNLRDEHGDSPLHIAIMLNRDTGVLQSLLSGGADISIRNIDGKTPLYLAVEESRTALIPLLLSYQSDVFAADNDGITPFNKALETGNPVLAALITTETVFQTDSAGNTILHTAIQNSADIKTIVLILEQRALVNARNREGDTSLHLAVRMNNTETGELLIARGADIFAPNARGEIPLYLAFHSPGAVRRWMINDHTIAARDGLGNGILHYAAQWKIDSHIPYIVQQGAYVEAVNATGETPLFVAVKYNGVSTIETLVKAGATINSRDSLGNSALHAAVRWNNPEAALALINGGIDVNAHALNGKTPLHDAVRLGITGVETLLIERGADIEIRDAEGNSPFMEAVIAGYGPAAERLVDMGADPTTRNSQGNTPLHVAVSAGRSDLVNQLLSWGAPIHVRNSQGLTPFRIALAHSPAMVSTLLTKDRIRMADDDGASPLHIAISEGADPSTIRTIIAQGARLSPVDSEGRSPLRLAVDREAWELAKVLADAGADPFTLAGDGKTPGEITITKGQSPIQAVFSGRAINSRDSSGNTILHYAARSGSPETVALLLQLGASKTIKNISAESPADIARRWNRSDTLAMLN